MMLAFFLKRLDLLDRVMANLLVGFLLGATTTASRVVALEAVSTTSPLNMDDNSAKAYTSRDTK
jgi:hypothetical protein